MVDLIQPQVPGQAPAPVQPQPQPSAIPSQPAPQPVFYSLSPEEPPRPTPWYRRRQMVALGLSLVLALLVLGGAVFAGNWYMNRSTPAKIAQEVATDMLADKVADCEQAADPEACKSAAGMQVANTTGETAACADLTGEAYDSCVSLAARTSAKVSACGTLEGDAKTACEDSAYAAEAELKMDIRLCAKIVNEQTASGCVTHVTDAAVAASACAAAHVEESLCTTAAALRAAIATGLEANCAALATEDLKIDCTNGIHSFDEDGDGLSVFDEVNIHHTDPVKPDTDGDGYTDGEEIASGHDPLKK
jgi:hypothetical protein